MKQNLKFEEAMGILRDNTQMMMTHPEMLKEGERTFLFRVKINVFPFLPDNVKKNIERSFLKSSDEKFDPDKHFIAEDTFLCTGQFITELNIQLLNQIEDNKWITFTDLNDLNVIIHQLDTAPPAMSEEEKRQAEEAEYIEKMKEENGLGFFQTNEEMIEEAERIANEAAKKIPPIDEMELNGLMKEYDYLPGEVDYQHEEMKKKLDELRKQESMDAIVGDGDPEMEAKATQKIDQAMKEFDAEFDGGSDIPVKSKEVKHPTPIEKSTEKLKDKSKEDKKSDKKDDKKKK